MVNGKMGCRLFRHPISWSSWETESLKGNWMLRRYCNADAARWEKVCSVPEFFGRQEVALFVSVSALLAVAKKWTVEGRNYHQVDTGSAFLGYSMLDTGCWQCRCCMSVGCCRDTGCWILADSSLQAETVFSRTPALPPSSIEHRVSQEHRHYQHRASSIGSHLANTALSLFTAVKQARLQTSCGENHRAFIPYSSF